ncbi:lipoprotein [Leptospira perolatii]|uniref:Lipoprotein n=1 Tax=Leptospira perolatii TaxID=2023191 RepID=A0A2M9ZKJ9_9LEPT|nr:lipoprotein [Leptospira perolatii]PJZ69386.1 lipoprotein [Leptospira perolatii]PJZ72521.1 lipoprotein [Leptospira perolatii]
MFLRTLSILALISAFFYCSSGGNRVEVQEQKSVVQESDHTAEDQFVKATEGFLDSSTYQVVVSSLESNEGDALELARKRALNLFIAERGDLFKPNDRKHLKEIVENKGKIVKTSKPIHGKTYYLFHVVETDLKTQIKR